MLNGSSGLSGETGIVSSCRFCPCPSSARLFYAGDQQLKTRGGCTRSQLVRRIIKNVRGTRTELRVCHGFGDGVGCIGLASGDDGGGAVIVAELLTALSIAGTKSSRKVPSPECENDQQHDDHDIYRDVCRAHHVTDTHATTAPGVIETSSPGVM